MYQFMEVLTMLGERFTFEGSITIPPARQAALLAEVTASPSLWGGISVGPASVAEMLADEFGEEDEFGEKHVSEASDGEFVLAGHTRRSADQNTLLMVIARYGHGRIECRNAGHWWTWLLTAGHLHEAEALITYPDLEGVEPEVLPDQPR